MTTEQIALSLLGMTFPFLVGGVVAVVRRQNDHEGRITVNSQKITALEQSQERQDSDLHKIAELLTGTRELLIERFAKVFAKLDIKD
jgi:Tfp pilus assembly protein PilN